MKPEQLQLVWQTQPRTEADVALVPVKASQPARDFAVPTARFRVSRSQPLSRSAVVGRAALAMAAVAAVLVVVGTVRFMTAPAPAVAPPPLPPLPVDARDEVEELLAECRTWSSVEGGVPDFERADAACRRADVLAPHGEAERLQLHIVRLRVCEADLARAREAGAAGRVEEAVGTLALIGESCDGYLPRAQAYANQVLPLALAKLKAQCETTGAGCDEYVKFACQRSSLAGDPVVERLRKTNALGPDWRCPGLASLRPPRTPATREREALERRYADTELATAALLYFDGNHEEAQLALERESSGRAAEFSKDLKDVRRLVAELFDAMKRDELPRAARQLDGVLALDAKWMRGPDDVVLTQSEVRRAAVVNFVRGTYEDGKRFADRKDFRAACRSWKLGSVYSRADLDLLKALTNVCTKKAASALAVALTCAQLDAVLDFAVDGDGYEELVLERKRKEGCPE